MMLSFLIRLLLAVVLVVNGTGSALAAARGLALVSPAGAQGAATGMEAPGTGAAGGHADWHGGASPAAQPASAAGKPSLGDGTVAAACHDAPGLAGATPAAADGGPDHGLCCHDACHCVCTLQAHGLATLPAPVPLRAVAGLFPPRGWAAPAPALPLRPPIA